MQIRQSVLSGLVCIGLLLTACNFPQDQVRPNETLPTEAVVVESPTAMATSEPPRVLQICLKYEPGSLFLYGDHSQEAMLVRQAIYDGPVDKVKGEYSPVILGKNPLFLDGDVFLEPVEVSPGTVIADAWGKLVRLEAEVNYFPSGCQDFSCVLPYSGSGAVRIDQQVVRFSLKEGINWSDGTNLNADDSVFSYEIAQIFYPKVAADTIPYTASYLALDEHQIEWRSMPGYQTGDYLKFFFHPLPRHAWGEMSAEELITAESVNRLPLGWGAYVIEEWLPGKELVLSKNPGYFRSGEGLPKTDQIIVRFIANLDDAYTAFSAGECDVLGPGYGIETNAELVQSIDQDPEMRLEFFENKDWEHLDFGISSLNVDLPALFQNKVTRQAIAMCIDRQQINHENLSAAAQIPHSFVSTSHPLYHPGVRSYAYDPEGAATLFEFVGWLDLDSNPATPRTAQGVIGVVDGTPFEFILLTTPEDERQHTAQLIRENLSACGVQIQIEILPGEELYLPGPEGKIFGRQFQAAQFSWSSSDWPICNLFTSQEIPGEYPQFSKGWGGANLSGYSSLEYDQACALAKRALPGTPESSQYDALFQSIFSEDLPSIPLFFRQDGFLSRAELCESLVDPVSGFSLWNIELLSFNEDCAN